MGNLFDEHSGAVFSDDNKYRYRLWRKWDEALPMAMCIGLNPSNADADKNDPTITNLIKMLQLLGYGGFYMMNLFAFISSKPEDLLTCTDPLGENDAHLQEVEKLCKDVIVCWGSFKIAAGRIEKVLPMYPEALCFGVNADGTPFHPMAMMYKGLVKTPELVKYKQTKTVLQKWILSKKKNVRVDIFIYKSPDGTHCIVIETKRLIDFKQRKIASLTVVYSVDTLNYINEALCYIFTSSYAKKELNFQVPAKPKWQASTNIDNK